MSDDNRLTSLLGVPVHVVEDLDAEDADFVVCGSVSRFADDVHTVCSHCQTPVVHRPYAPKRPPRICLECAVATASTKH